MLTRSRLGAEDKESKIGRVFRINRQSTCFHVLSPHETDYVWFLSHLLWSDLNVSNNGNQIMPVAIILIEWCDTKKSSV